MLPFEADTRMPWARLPVADPPARLRVAVLEDWQRAHGRRSGRMAGIAAGLAVAALFVLAVALPLRMQTSNAVDPALVLLRAQGLEVVSPPTAGMPAEVRHVASGSTAARLGLRPGDRLLSIELPMSANGMMNVAVLRGESPQYFALPNLVTRAAAPDAGMADTSGRDGAVSPRFAIATPAPGATSFLQTLA